MRKNVWAIIIVGLLIITALSGSVSASTTVGSAEIEVSVADAPGEVQLSGFSWDEGKGAWTRTWDSSTLPEIDVEIDIDVLNMLGPDEEMDWKSVINITLIRWDPYMKRTGTWTNSNWPNYEGWDDESDDIHDTLQTDDTDPAAFQGNTWEFFLNITAWWDNGIQDSNQQNLIGYIEVG